MYITKSDYEKALETIVTYREQLKQDLNKINEIGVVDKNDLLLESGLDSRTCYRLIEGLCKYNESFKNVKRDIIQIKDLECVSKKEMRRFVGFGKKSMKDVVSLCERAGVSLRL